MTLREWVTGIRTALNTEWDPIGECPPDEYDNYVGLLLPILSRPGITDVEIARFLWRWETEELGLLGASDTRRTRTVAALRALGPGPTDEAEPE